MAPSESSEPNWDRLPENPQAFFGLEDGFDRLDLKRAYNGFLRRFKPERFPEEFKRIRAGFEQLEDALRWGEDNPEAEDSSDGLEHEFDARDRPVDSEGADAPVLDGVELLSTRTLQEAFEDLRDFEPKSPENWCQLALLRDELDRENPVAFFEVLIEGVLRTDSSHPVSTLLYHACRETLDVDTGVLLLERIYDLCSQGQIETSFRLEGYFYYTEQIWRNLSSELDFPVFAQTLEDQRQRVGDIGFEAYLGLLIRLIPRVGLSADPGWIEDAMAEVEENYHQLSAAAQDDVAQFDWLDRYRAIRRNFLNGDPIRERIDATLEQFSSGGEGSASAGLDALLSDFRANPDALMDAFPSGESEDLSCVLDPMWWLAEECADEIGETYELPAEEVVGFHVLLFAEDVEKKTDRSVFGALWMAATLVSLLGMLGVVLALPLWLIVLVTDDYPATRVLSILAWLAFAFAGSVRGYSLQDVLFLPSARWGAFFSKHIYRRSWRKQCIAFLTEHRLTLEQLCTGLQRIDEPGISNHQFLTERLVEDPGMSLYSLAVQFKD